MTQRPNQDTGDLVTPGQAASIAGVTPRTIYRYGLAGLLGFITLPSGHRRYLREDVEALRRNAA